MNSKQFAQLLKSKQKTLSDARSKVFPRVVGKLAVDHYRDNFHKSGFVNNGLNKWVLAKRLQSKTKGAKENYPTLLSSRKELYNSIRYVPGDASVKVGSPKLYAGVHNWGFTGVQNVPQHQRRNNWASNLQKATVTVKAHTRNQRIPQRQFIGRSKELDQAIITELSKRIKTILGIN